MIFMIVPRPGDNFHCIPQMAPIAKLTRQRNVIDFARRQHEVQFALNDSTGLNIITDLP